VAKRSPILGYNHNVRYRGLVFHVQTEDSGVLSPHLFTHLFHGGVIVSTRKLVYDAGSNEEAIKALMQAQHKAVMKDLRKGSFDDKIDQYLGGTPGLEPAQAKPAERTSTDLQEAASAASPTPEPPEPAAPEPAIEDERSEPSAPSIEIIPPSESVPILLAQPKPARTQTEDRTSSSKQARSVPPSVPPPILEEDEAPTLTGPDAKEVAATLKRAATPPPVPPAARLARLATPPPVPYKSLPQDFRIDSSPEIEISVEDDQSGRSRAPRDTAVESPADVTVPTPMPAAARRGDSTPPPSARRTPTGDRPASLVGATLPPAPKPASRPSITPPQVLSRPVAQAEGRGRDTDAIEVYAPAPPSAEPPPGERPRTPAAGTYSLGRGKQPSESVPLKETTGRIPAVRPPTNSSRPPQNASQSQRAPSNSQPPQRAQHGSAPPPIRPQPTPSAGVPQARPPQVTAPMSAARPPPSGVVMTRPAVIVGAPPKPATQTPPRVRKAREDEGRGFGQGLISEKSLDEVILAYLSEDAEEK